MNITQLKDTIIANPHYIEMILESIPIFKVRDFGREYRGARYEDGSATGVCVSKDTLKFFYRGRDGELTGDIITMVRDFKELSFVDAIKFICQSIGLETEQFDKTETVVTLPFSGYFKGIRPEDGDIYEKMQTYSEDTLLQYDLMPSKRFIKDGINAKVQCDFKVGYDYFSDRIIVPWRNPIGEIIGIMGRYNEDDFDKDIAKWFPIKKFSKSQVVFGFYENYKSIQESRFVVVGESEKFVMQLRSMETLIDKPQYDKDGNILREQQYVGYEFGLSVGSHSISNVQKRLIQSCFPDTIVIAFDEGIEESYLIETAKKLKYSNCFFQTNIGYIYDAEGLYLPKGSKASPTDFGKEVFDKLMCNCIKFI